MSGQTRAEYRSLVSPYYLPWPKRIRQRPRCFRAVHGGGGGEGDGGGGRLGGKHGGVTGGASGARGGLRAGLAKNASRGELDGAAAGSGVTTIRGARARATLPRHTSLMADADAMALRELGRHRGARRDASAACESALKQVARGVACDKRSRWLMGHRGLNASAALRAVATEFAQACGGIEGCPDEALASSRRLSSEPFGAETDPREAGDDRQ